MDQSLMMSSAFHFIWSKHQKHTTKQLQCNSIQWSINQNQSIPFQWFFYPRSVEAMRLFCIIFLFLSPFVFISEAILLLLYILSKFAFVSFHNSTPKFNAFSLSKKKFNAFFLPFAEIAGPVWDDMTFPGYGLWIDLESYAWAYSYL